MSLDIDVTIIVLTYNHENYIKECLESIYEQETSVNVELIIHDDGSKDNTVEIISSVINNNIESRIKVLTIFSKVNRMRSGQAFVSELYSLCSGRYVAFLDGDDYWIAKTKIQNQFDFLETNTEYVICATAFISGKSEIECTRHPRDESLRLIDVPIERFAIGNEIGTLTVMFRNKLKILPEEFDFLRIGDYPVWGLLSQYGKIAILNEITAFHRIHSNNSFSSEDVEIQFFAALEARRFISTNLTGPMQGIWIRAMSESIKDLYLDNRNLRNANLEMESFVKQLKNLEKVHFRIVEERNSLIQILRKKEYNLNDLGTKMNLVLLYKSFFGLLFSLLRK
jgi:glycosyltransferase involved in cell wall biosynthesis